MTDFQTNFPLLIPYKIDFSTKTVGKHIRQTKRHVNWKFGFAHIPSLLQGQSGTACRGVEMELHVIWSVASGKHEMYLNGQLVHQKYNSKMAVIPAQKFDYSLNVPEKILPGMHVLHVTAWALGIGQHANENQFSMSLDGEEYNNFYGIFELGSPNMMFRYAKPLEAVRRSNGMDPKGDDILYTPSSESNVSSPFNDMLQGRPRRSMSQSPEQNLDADDKYWRKPVVSVQKQSYSTYDNSSSSRSVLSGFKPQDVAITDEDEKRLIAEARLASLRDLRNSASHDSRSIQGENQRAHAQSKLNYFKNLSKSSSDDMSIPSFARPPPISKPQKYGHSNGFLQPVEEDKDLLDLGLDETRPTNIVRTQSSVTLDTALNDDFGLGPTFSNEDDMSIGSEVYSHLDPKNMWRTQQDVSFRFQHPPVYADSVAGDLVQPSVSSSQSVYSYVPSVVQPPMSQRFQNGYAPGPRPKTPTEFQAPPPPTFAFLNEAFGPNQSSFYSNQTTQPNTATFR